MSTRSDGTIRITKAAIRRRQLAQRVQGDFAYHAYGVATQACVVLMSSGIVFSIVGLRWGPAGNALLAICSMGLIGAAGAWAVSSATHRDYGGVMFVGAGVTGFLGMLVGEHVAAGWAGTSLGAQLGRDILAVLLGTAAAVGGAYLARNLQGGSLWDLVAGMLAGRAQSAKPVEPIPAKPEPSPAPAPRSNPEHAALSPNVAIAGSKDGDICLVCTDESNRIRPGDMCITCPDCGARHHTECWEQNGGCGALHETR